LRTPDDLDAIDVHGRQVGEVEAAAKRVRRHAVDDDERIVGFAAAWKDAREGAAAARARDTQSRNDAQPVCERLRLAGGQLGARDDRHARRGRR
jgi:hypothetical protein